MRMTKLQIEIPHYEHKYLTLFDNEEGYRNKEDSFEEVNYSAVKTENSDDSKRNYQPSNRVTNKDDEYIMNYWKSDVMRGKFFLEIIWGYFGWEWKDYELNGRSLAGGNLYKVKEIEVVRSIIDGYRLQHINNFLNSQDKVVLVEWFDVSNIIAANNAFARLTYPDNGSGDLPNLSYLGMTLNITGFPEVVQADKMFKCNELHMKDNSPLLLPNLVSANQFYALGKVTDGLKFQMENLEEFTYGFMLSVFPDDSINLNSYFVGDTLAKVRNLKGLMRGAVVPAYNGKDSNEIKDNASAAINLDLTNSTIDDNSVIDLSEAFSIIRCNADFGVASHGTLNINLDFDKYIDLSSAFYGLVIDKEVGNKLTFDDFVIQRGYKSSFKTLNIDFTTDPVRMSLIKSLDYAFMNNVFNELPPITYRPGNATDEGIYQDCKFLAGLDYDFSPDHAVNNSSHQFDNCYIAGGVDLKNVDFLKEVWFEKITLDTPAEFPAFINNDNMLYDGSRYRVMFFYISQFSGFKDDSLYIKAPAMVDLTLDNQYNPFHRMEFVDFDENFHVYFEPFLMGRLENRTYNFKGNTSMTRTPHIHLKTTNETPQYSYLKLDFENLVNLTDIRLDEFRPYCSGYVESNVVNCKGCENLIYFRCGPVYRPTFNFEKCSRLDIPTLEKTLSGITRVDDNGTVTGTDGVLTIMTTVWNQLGEDIKNKCIDTFRTVNLVD